MQGQISEYRIINGEIVEFKTIYYTALDSKGGNVRIDRVVNRTVNEIALWLLLERKNEKSRTILPQVQEANLCRP